MKKGNKAVGNLVLIYVRSAIGIITFFLINSFLSGKIIDIPHGTQRGGIISAIGVVIILIIMFMVILIGSWLCKKHLKQNEK